MDDYVIVCESTTDLPQSLADELGLVVIPMTFKDDRAEYVNYLDGREMSSEEFYKLEREGSAFTTAQITPNHFIEVLKPILDTGKNVLIVGFSSGLSGTVNSAHLAIEELKEEYPNNKVLLLDSLCASMGEGLLVWYAKQNMLNGMSLEENYKWLMEHKLNLAHWFTVSDIDFLKRGGRLSNASAFIAKALKINPVLHVDNLGHLVNRFKKIGRKTAINEMLKQFSETVDRTYKQTIFISHGDCLEDAEYLASRVREIVDVQDIVINSIGPVIGAHSGPGTLAIFFMASHR